MGNLLHAVRAFQQLTAFHSFTSAYQQLRGGAASFQGVGRTQVSSSPPLTFTDSKVDKKLLNTSFRKHCQHFCQPQGEASPLTFSQEKAQAT